MFNYDTDPAATEDTSVDPVATISNDIAAHPAAPGESPQAYEYRRADESANVAKATYTKAKDFFGKAAIPTYDAGGILKPVTDESGQPLTKLDKGNSVAWDSWGQPRKITPKADGTVDLTDPYVGAPTKVDKAGNTYSAPKDMEWRWTGTDPATVQANQAKAADQQDRATAQAATALGQQVAGEQRTLKQAAKDLRNQQKALSTGTNITALNTITDPVAAAKAIDDEFDTKDTSAEANKRVGWFNTGDLTPEAKAIRDQNAQGRAAAHAQLDAITQQRQALDQSQQATAQKAAQAKELQDRVVATKLAKAQVAIPATVDHAAQNSPQNVLSPEDSKRLTDTANAMVQGAFGPGSIAWANNLMDNAEVQRAREVATQNLTAAKNGARSYGADDQGNVQFKPEAPWDGLKEAVKDGVIDLDWAKDHESKFKIAQLKYQELVESAGGQAEAGALLHGAGLGTAFLGAAIPGAKAGAALGAMVPGAGETGVSEFIGGAIGGLATGSIGAFAARKGLEKLAETHAAFKSLNDAAELHPNYDAAGQLLSFTPSAVESVSNLVRLGKIAAATGGGLAAAKAIGLKVGAGAAGGLAFEGALRPAFDATVNFAADKLGLEHKAVQAPDAKSMLTNLALGVLLAGHDIKFKDINVNDATSILYRDKVRTNAGLKPGDEMTVPQVVEAMKSAGVDIDSAKAQDLTRPLSEAESHFAKVTNDKLASMQAAGVTGVEFKGGEQATTGRGKPLASSADIAATGQAPESPNEPTTPTEPSPEPSDLEAPTQPLPGSAEPASAETPPAEGIAPASSSVVEPGSAGASKGATEPENIPAEGSELATLRQRVQREPSSQMDAALLDAEKKRITEIEANPSPTAPAPAAAETPTSQPGAGSEAGGNQLSDMIAKNNANVMDATKGMKVGDESLHDWGRRQIAENPSKTAFAVALQEKIPGFDLIVGKQLAGALKSELSKNAESPSEPQTTTQPSAAIESPTVQSQRLDPKAIAKMPDDKLADRLGALRLFFKGKTEAGEPISEDAMHNVANLYQEARKRGLVEAEPTIEAFLAKNKPEKPAAISPKAQREPAPAPPKPVEPAASRPTSPAHALETVKTDIAKALKIPANATAIQATDSRGKTQLLLKKNGDWKGANPWLGEKWKSVKAGNLSSKGEFMPVKGTIELVEPKEGNPINPDLSGKPSSPEEIKAIAQQLKDASESGGREVPPEVEEAAKTGKVPTVEEQKVTKLANSALALHHAELDAVGHPHEFIIGQTQAASGIETDVDTQKIRLDPAKLATATAKMTPTKALEFVKRAVAEEVIHVGTLKYAAESEENRARLLALNDDKELMNRAGEAYGKEWDGLSDFAKAAEGARMLLQGPEELTEQSYKFLKSFLDWLKTKLKSLSKDTRELLDGIREKLGRFEKTAEATKEQTPPEARTKETVEREWRESSTRLNVDLPSKKADIQHSAKAKPELDSKLSDVRREIEEEAKRNRALKTELASFAESKPAKVEAEQFPLIPEAESPAPIKTVEAAPAETKAAEKLAKAPDTLPAKMKVSAANPSLAAATPSERPYENVPDSLMGYRKNGPQKGFEETKYPHTQPVRVTFDDGESMVDAVKGMNEQHALERAHRNWPSAKIETATQGELDSALASDELHHSQFQPRDEDGTFKTGETLGAANPFGTILQQFKDEIKSGGVKDAIKSRHDSIENIADYHGSHASESILLDYPDAKNREAAPFIIEGSHDPVKLAAHLASERAKIAASSDPKLAAKWLPVIDHAIANQAAIAAKRDNHDRLMGQSHTKLRASGRDVGTVDDYVRRVLDPPQSVQDALPNPLFGKGGGGGSSPKGFTKGRVFETLGDAIQAGYQPATTDLAALDHDRIAAGEKLMEQDAMISALKGTMAPSDGKPIIGKLQQVPKLNGETEAQVPRGYSVVQVGGRPLVVHNQVAGLMEALNSASVLRQSTAGRALVGMAGIAKHGTLMFDSFHAGRLAYKMVTSGGGTGIGRGVAALRFSDADLPRAVAAGEVSNADAQWAVKNRHAIEQALRSGANIGRVADNLWDQSKASNIPVIKQVKGFNRWLFKKLAPAAMTQAWVANYQRNLTRPGMTPERAARLTSKEMNAQFGNLRSQGIFQSKTAQDIASLFALAPNWTVSQFINELRSYAQLPRFVKGLATGNGFSQGNAARAFIAGALALFALNQLINFITRRKPTWQNEEGHKLDGWFPGGKRGFFFNPFEIAGEYLHATLKYLAQNENPVDVAAHIASNKMSPLARAAKEAITGTDYSGRHFLTGADRARAAITDALPMPIGLNAAIEKDPRQPFGYRLTRQPGSLEKQALQSAGMKVTAVQSPRTLMFAIAQPFRPDRGSKDSAGEYTELRRALDADDMDSARSEIKWLYGRGKDRDAILHAVGVKKDGTIGPELFAGGADREKAMLATFKPDQRALYQKAQADHRDNAAKLLRIIGSVPPPATAPPARHVSPAATDWWKH